MKGEALLAVMTSEAFRSEVEEKLLALLATSYGDLTLIESQMILTIFRIGNERIDEHTDELRRMIEATNVTEAILQSE